jgi:hypothetical protein
MRLAFFWTFRSVLYASVIRDLALEIAVSRGTCGGMWDRPCMMLDNDHLAAMTVLPALARSGDQS